MVQISISAPFTAESTFINVTDYGADPTGVANSAAAIQSAIDAAVSDAIHTIRFPKGTYLWNTQVDLPATTANRLRRLTLDFGGSRINTTGNITLMDRSITDISDVSTLDYTVTIQNGEFVQQGTAGNGTVFEAHKMSNIIIKGCSVDSFNTFCRLVFCLHHLVESVNAVSCINPFICMGGDGEFTGATATNSNSNVGTWVDVRAQTTSTSAVAFLCSNSSNVVYINCTAEGSNVGTGWKLAGDQGSGAVSQRDVRLINCWAEYTTAINNAIIEIADLQKSVVDIQIHSGAWPGDPLFLKVTGQTLGCLFTIHGTSAFNENASQTSPFFDAGILSGPSQKNYWKFVGCITGTGDRFTDSDRWTVGANGTVPANLHEDTFSYVDGLVYRSRETISANSILANVDTSNTALVSEITSGTLSTGSRSAGAVVLGWDASGDLAEFDAVISTVSRKESIDDLGSQSGATYTVDFDAGSYDNKEFTAANNIALTLSATNSGRYILRIRTDGTNGRTITMSATTMVPAVTTLPINGDANSLTVFNLEYDSTNDEWHW